MGNFLILSDNAADEGTLSGGNWAVSLPAMQDPRPTKRARSANLELTSTQFRIALNKVATFRALAFGPTNFTSSARYRITAYSDADFLIETYDSDWQDIGAQAVPSLSLEWENPDFWTGVEPIDDPDNAGIFVIHDFVLNESGKYWQFEIDDQGNGDGFVEIGRLFMGAAYQPSINYLPNSFGFETNTTMEKALGGTRYYTRRKSARTLNVTFEYLPVQEVWDNVYRLQVISGLDRQVFVIPDPDDIPNRNKRSFLGNFKELTAIQLLNVALETGLTASTSFQITEAL